MELTKHHILLYGISLHACKLLHRHDAFTSDIQSQKTAEGVPVVFFSCLIVMLPAHIQKYRKLDLM